MRCPFRMKGFDQPDTCDPECAWLVDVEVWSHDEYYELRKERVGPVCAVAASAMGCADVMPVNALEVKQ